MCLCAVFADWSVALGRWTVHAENTSINQRDRHPLQHYSYHHDNTSKSHCMLTDTNTSAVVHVVFFVQLLADLHVADILWLTDNYHIKSPFCFFLMQNQSSWDQRNLCCTIVLPWVLQMRIYPSASAEDNNLPSQPFSASVVNIDPVSSHFLTVLPVTRNAVFKYFTYSPAMLMNNHLWILKSLQYEIPNAFPQWNLYLNSWHELVFSAPPK